MGRLEREDTLRLGTASPAPLPAPLPHASAPCAPPPVQVRLAPGVQLLGGPGGGREGAALAAVSRADLLVAGRGVRGCLQVMDTLLTGD